MKKEEQNDRKRESNMELGKFLGRGATAEVYEYGEDKVIKLYLEGFHKDNVQWEFDKTREINKHQLPAPKVYDIIEYDGRYGIVMEHIHGQTFMDEMIQLISESEEKEENLEAILHSPQIVGNVIKTAELLYELHKVKANLMDTMTNSLTWSVNNNTYLSEEEKQIVLSKIAKLPKGDRVCHGDPNPGNIMNQDGNPFFIDWVNSVVGHPFYDLAQYVIMSRYPTFPEELPKSLLKAIEETKEQAIDLFLNSYQEISGCDLTGLEEFILPLLVSKLDGGGSEEYKLGIVSDIRDMLFKK